MAKFNDLTGRKFDKLTVHIRHPENNKRGETQWVCYCECGNGEPVIARAGNLTTGHTRSCGCLTNRAVNKLENVKRYKDLPEYGIWIAMKQRCYNERHPKYKDYGKRGIAVCESWRESFETFYKDIGPRPTPYHSIERRENDQGYSKDNCQWATRIEQANNTRKNVYYEFDGERKTLAEWCREFNVDYRSVAYLLRRGLSLEDAIDSCLKTNKD